MIELFEIGVAMSMTNGISSVLSTIGRDLLGMGHQIDGINGKFSKMHVAVGGLGVALAGAGVLGALVKISDVSSKQVDTEERLLTAGMKRAEIAQLTAKAWDLANTKRDFSSTEYLDMMAEMRNALPDTAEVLKISPYAADFMTDMRMGDPNQDPHGMLQDALKAISIRGRLYHPGTRDLDEAGIQDEMDWQGRATRFTNGQQNAHTFRQTAAMAGPAARGMSAEAFYGFGAEVSNTLNASKTGTALSSLFQQFIGGTMPKWMAENLINSKSGILHKDRVKFQSGHANLEEGALDDQKGFTSNPFTWLRNAIQKYAKAEHITDQEAGYKILGRATTQRLGNDVVANIGELINSFQKQQEAWGIKATADEARNNSPDNLKHQMSAGFEDAQVAMGKSLWAPGGAFTSASKGITDALRSFTVWATDPKNATTISTIVRLTAALGAFMVVGGGLAILSVAFAALSPILLPLAIGAAALWAAFKLLTPAQLQQLGTMFSGLFSQIGSALGTMVTNLTPYAKQIGQGLITLLASFFDFGVSLVPDVQAIGNALVNILAAIGDFIIGLAKGALNIGSSLKNAVGGMLTSAHDHLFGKTDPNEVAPTRPERPKRVAGGRRRGRTPPDRIASASPRTCRPARARPPSRSTRRSRWTARPWRPPSTRSTPGLAAVPTPAARATTRVARHPSP